MNRTALSPPRVAACAVLFLLLPRLGDGLHAQARLVRPGDGTLRADRLVPFEATYEQLGFPFVVRLVRTNEERPVLSFQMIVNGPSGVGIDHVGHYADDLSFAYRRFGFGAYRSEYVEVEAEGEHLLVRRMAREWEPEATAPARFRLPLKEPVVDGTFMYWLLGALPLAEGAAFQLPVWWLTSEAVELRTSPVLRATARDTVRLADGTRFDAWIVEAESRQGDTRMWVTNEPPYLLRQEMVDPEGKVTPVVTLKGMGSGG